MPLIPLALSLAQFAPNIIKFFTGSDKDAAVAQKVVDIASAVTGAKSPEEAIQRIHASSEAQLAFQQAALAQEGELEKARLAADVAFQQQAQESGRIEAQSADEYVRRTRPGIARASFAAGVVYAFITGVLFPLLKAWEQFSGTNLPGLDAYVLGALYAPALTFMGVRSFEAFSKQGKK